MAILFIVDAEGTTDEADVASGAGQNDWTQIVKAPATALAKYDSLRAAHGTRSIRFSRSVAGDNVYARKALAAPVTRMQARAYVYMTALPTSQLNLMAFRHATGFMGYCGISATGKLGLYNRSNTIISGTASPDDFLLNTWVRIDAAVEKGSTTVAPFNGKIGFSYSALDNAAVEHTASPTNVDTGTVDPIECRFGLNGTTIVPADIWMDDLAIGDGLTGWIGPSSVTAPVISITADTRHRVDARGSTVPSAPAAYSINPTTGVIEEPEGVFNILMSTVEQTYTVTVVGATGPSTDQIVLVPPLTGGSLVREYLMEAGALV